MQANTTAYALWGGFLALLAVQFFWSHFVAYPLGFERMLRRGRSWVYVPLRWKGFQKIQILFASRLLVLGVALLLTLLLVHHTGRRNGFWVAGFAIISYAAAVWFQRFCDSLRYRQQEDAYFLQLDELRERFITENKDYSDAQLRSLTAYQHQQGLHKADEEGKFLVALRDEARRFRKTKAASPAAPLAPEA